MGSDFVLKGRSLVEQNQLYQAVEVCRTGLLNEPGQFEGRLILGAALMALGRYQEVVSEMKLALDRIADHPQALALQGEALMNLGDWANAVQVLERAQRQSNDKFIRSLFEEAEAHRKRNLGTPGPWGPTNTVNLDYALLSGDIRKIEERDVTAETTGTSELSPADLLPVEDSKPAHEVRAIEVGSASALASASVVRRTASADTQAKASIDVEPSDVLLSRDVPLVHGRTTNPRDRADSDVFDFGADSDPKGRLPSQHLRQEVPTKSVEELFPEDESGVSRIIDLKMVAAQAGVERPKRVVRISSNPPEPRSDVRPKARRDGAVSAPAPSSKSLAWRNLAEQAQTTLRGVARPGKARPGGGFWAEVTFYLGLAVVVMVGSVYGGFALRDWRLSGEMTRARATVANMTLDDSLPSYVAMLQVEDRIARVIDRADARAAQVRARAALAVEFGYEKKAALEYGGKVGRSGLDATIARTYLALAKGDSETADKGGAELFKSAKGSWLAMYLSGRAALLTGNLPAADKALSRAISLSNRPLVVIANSDLDLLLGKNTHAMALLSTGLGHYSAHPGLLSRQGVLLGETFSQEIDRARLEAELSKASVKSEVDGAPGQAAWTALGLADALLSRGDYDGANRALSRAEKHGDKDDRVFVTFFASALLRAGLFQSAKTEIEAASKRWPSGAETNLLQAELALARGEFPAVEELVGAEPSLRGRALRGRARLLRGQWNDAEADLQAVLKDEPGHRLANLSLAFLALRRGNADAAMAIVKPLYDRGERGDVSVLMAEALRLRGEPVAARDALGAAFVSGSSALFAYVQAQFHRMDGKTADIPRALQQALERDPGFVPARYELASEKRDNGDRALARKEFDDLSRGADFDGPILLEAARLAIEFGDHARATTLLDRLTTAKDAASFAWQVQRERGRILMREGDVAGAVRALERAKSLMPGDKETNLLLIEVYSQAGTTSAVDKVLAELSASLPNSSIASLALGQARIFANKNRDAEAALARAQTQALAEKAPASWLAEIDFWQGRAWENDNPSRAQVFFDRCLSRNPNHAGAHFHRGNLYFDASDLVRAAAEYQQAVTLDPVGYPKAYFLLGTLLVDMKQAEPAKAALKTFLERAPNDVDAEEARSLLKQL